MIETAARQMPSIASQGNRLSAICLSGVPSAELTKAMSPIELTVTTAQLSHPQSGTRHGSRVLAGAGDNPAVSTETGTSSAAASASRVSGDATPSDSTL